MGRDIDFEVWRSLICSVTLSSRPALYQFLSQRSNILNPPVPANWELILIGSPRFTKEKWNYINFKMNFRARVIFETPCVGGNKFRELIPRALITETRSLGLALLKSECP